MYVHCTIGGGAGWGRVRGWGACCIVHAITSICNHTCSKSCSWNQAENRPAVRDVYIFCIIYKVKAYANHAMGYVQCTIQCTIVHPWIYQDAFVQRQKWTEELASPTWLHPQATAANLSWAHLYMSANFCNILPMSIGKGRVYEKRGGKGSEMNLCLRIAILWSMGNPMPELTLTQLHS